MKIQKHFLALRAPTRWPSGLLSSYTLPSTHSNEMPHTLAISRKCDVSLLQYKYIHSEDDERELAACVAPSGASLG